MRARRARLSLLLCVVVLSCVLAGGASFAAQDRVPTLVLETFSFSHQPARESLALIEPLLSKRGTVSLDRQQNTVVVRDELEVLESLRPFLEEFDHEPRWLRLEVHVLEAERVAGVVPSRSDPSVQTSGVGFGPRREIEVLMPGAGGRPGVPAREVFLPDSLRQSLGGLLAFSHYELLDRAVLVAREGDHVVRRLGDYELSFELGTVLLKRRLRLRALHLKKYSGTAVETGGGEALFHSDINLHSAKPLLVTVSADSASSRGLVLAVRWLDSPRVSPPVVAR